MTKEEAIKTLANATIEPPWGGSFRATSEALDMAIEALQNKSRPFGDCSKCIHTYGTLGCCTTVSNEWVYDCEHGMEQYKNTKAEPSEDGTLEVKVEDATKIGRVLISDDEHRGGLYYPDEYEPQGDLISRADAIEAIENTDWYHQNQNKDMVSGANSDEHQAWYKADDVHKTLEAVPSADRPRGEWLEVSSFESEKHSVTDMRCSICGKYASMVLPHGTTCVYDYCPNCGADMRPTERSEE